MPSFDVVSEVDLHEVRNAVDQANREVGTLRLQGHRLEVRAEREDHQLDAPANSSSSR